MPSLNKQKYSLHATKAKKYRKFIKKTNKIKAL
jgi:hypothetical protein